MAVLDKLDMRAMHHLNTRCTSMIGSDAILVGDSHYHRIFFVFFLVAGSCGGKLWREVVAGSCGGKLWREVEEAK